MADSRVQLQAEDWIRSVWLPGQFNQQFRRERLRLTAGGVFEFDAVSADNAVVASISTSNGITAGGKTPAAKIQKLRADMLFLLMVHAKRRLIILTEKDMFEICQKEKGNGRVPEEIEFLHAELPVNLAAALRKARKMASDEVSPGRNKGTH
jgi:hypothetical protein